MKETKQNVNQIIEQSYDSANEILQLSIKNYMYR